MIELHAFATKAGRQAGKHKLQVCLGLIICSLYSKLLAYYEKIGPGCPADSSPLTYFLSMLIIKLTHDQAQKKWVGGTKY